MRKTLILFICFPVWTQSVFNLDMSRSELRASVKASFHSFDVTAGAIDVDVTLGENNLPAHAQIKIPLHTLKSKKKKRDREMKHWLEVDLHPSMWFKLDHWRMDGNQMVAEGILHLHGVDVSRSIPLVYAIDDQGSISVTGQFDLNTTDFGLPVIQKFGMLKVDPEIHIQVALFGSMEVQHAAAH